MSNPSPELVYRGRILDHTQLWDLIILRDRLLSKRFKQYATPERLMFIDINLANKRAEFERLCGRKKREEIAAQPFAWPNLEGDY